MQDLDDAAPGDLISRADPLRSLPPPRIDADAIVDRITARPARRRAHRHRRAVLAGSVLAAAALVAGLFVIAGSQGPAGGLVLAERLLGAAVFDSNAPGTPPGSVTFVTRYRFRAGPSLDRTAHTGVGYALVVPTDKRSFLEHLAHVFGVSGSYTTPAPGRGYWSIGSPKGRAVYYYTSGGVPRWGYVAGPCWRGSARRTAVR